MTRPAGRSFAVTIAVMPGAFAAAVTSSSRIPPRPAVRGRGADDPGPQLPGDADVVAEPAAAAEQPGILVARQPGADSGHEVSPGSPRAWAPRAWAVARTASMRPW